MGIKKKLMGAGLVAVMSLSFATGALANTGDVVKNQDVDITIKAGNIGKGGLDLITSPINSFGVIELTEEPVTHTTSFEKDTRVKDLRGTHEGWNLTVQASEFDSGSHKLPTGTLALDGISEVNRVGTGTGDLPEKKLDKTTIIDEAAVPIANAPEGTGMGVFDFGFDEGALGLTVDATTAKVGTYKSTLTWNLQATPDAK